MKNTGTYRVKKNLAEMLKGGVIMDVVNAEQAKIAEEAGAVSVMALERIPADIRSEGGVSRMSSVEIIEEVINAVSIPVMAKARIGHFVEAQILQELGIDFIDESEVLTPADPKNHIDKSKFTTPFVCGATNLGEAARRISEGAAMIRTKGEAGTGNVIEVNTNNEIVWHLNVKEPNNLPVAMYRSERIPSLYPNVFSFQINNLSGSYNDGYYMSYSDSIQVNLYNQGWSNQIFVFQLSDINGDILDGYQTEISEFSSQIIDMSISNPLIDNYTLKIFSLNDTTNYQSITFNNNFILGDINNDQATNILDVVALVNCIISNTCNG